MKMELEIKQIKENSAHQTCDLVEIRNMIVAVNLKYDQLSASIAKVQEDILSCSIKRGTIECIGLIIKP